MSTTWTYFKDLAYRVVMTYLQTFAGLVTASGFGWLDLGSWRAAALAAVPAAYAVIKGAVARFVGDRATAALVRTARKD